MAWIVTDGMSLRHPIGSFLAEYADFADVANKFTTPLDLAQNKMALIVTDGMPLRHPIRIFLADYTDFADVANKFTTPLDLA